MTLFFSVLSPKVSIMKFFLLVVFFLTGFRLSAQFPEPDHTSAVQELLNRERKRILSEDNLPLPEKLSVLIRLGLWDKAAEIFAQNNSDTDELKLMEAEFLILNHVFAKAESRVDSLLTSNPLNRKARLLLARLRIEAWLLDDAEKICTELLRINERDEDAVLVLGRTLLLKKNYPKALALAQQVIQWNPANAEAHLLEADVHFWNQEPEKAEPALRRCLEQDPFNADARFNYGYAIWRRVDATQLKDMAAQWEIALAVNPLHYLTHWHWGNGHTHLTFADYVDPDEEEILHELEPAEMLISQNRLDEAIRIIEGVGETFFASVIPPMMLGSVYYMAYDKPVWQRLDSAQAVFLKILRQKPHYGPAHNGLAAVIKYKRFQYLAAFDSLEKVIVNTQVEDTQSFESVFPDANYYPGDRVQKMIWNQLYTSVVYFPFLVKLNRQFVIPPLHIDLSHAMNNTYFRGATTFDNRQWMDIRGVGSGATGIEYVERAAHLERNVTLHEYVHLFHGTIFTDEEMRKVRACYYDAMANGRILDYYSANNEFEFLAQTFPAYFIPVKVHPLNHKSMNTTGDLLKKDPQTYSFIDSLVKRHRAYLAGDSTSMAGNWAQVYLSLAESAQYDGNNEQALRYLDTARVWDSVYLPVYLAYAGIHADENRFEQAAEWIRKASAINPGYGPIYQKAAAVENKRFLQGKSSLATTVKEQAHLYHQAEMVEDDFSVRAELNESHREFYRNYALLAEAIEAAENYATHAPTISTYLRDRKDEAMAFAWEIRGKMGYAEESVLFFENLISQKPQNYYHRMQFAQVLIANGLCLKAIEVLGESQAILEAAGNPNPIFTGLMAKAFLITADTTRALATLAPIEDGTMQRQGDQNMWIRLDAELGKLAKARTAFSRMDVPRLPYPKAEYYFTAGILAEKEGKTDMATIAYTQAVEANPYHFEARLQLLQLLEKQSDTRQIKKIATKGTVLPVPPGPLFLEKLEKYLD
ncbi:MAG: tetratricopeptide repeat protein [Bacteroidia bacterium]|nr:tetratricopeptide repeat protein [Bacteroidia bacterium]